MAPIDLPQSMNLLKPTFLRKLIVQSLSYQMRYECLIVIWLRRSHDRLRSCRCPKNQTSTASRALSVL